MALKLVTFEDKQNLSTNESIARINKVTDDDINQLKDVANTNANNAGDMEQLNTTDKSSLVNAINELIGKLGNNHIKLSNGILIIWGTVDVGNISASNEKRITINLPQNYIDTNYSCILTKKGTGAYWSNIADTVAEKTNSSVILSLWNNANNQATIAGIEYITIGKWK